MSQETRLLHRAAQLITQDKKAEARAVLTAVLRKQPANATARRLYAQTFDAPAASGPSQSWPYLLGGFTAVALLILLFTGLWHLQQQNRTLQSEINTRQQIYRAERIAEQQAQLQTQQQWENRQAELADANGRLRQNLDELQQEHEMLRVTHETAVDQLQRTRADHNDAIVRLTAVSQERDNWQQQYNAAAGSLARMTSDRDAWQSSYYRLLNEHNILLARTGQTPYVHVHNQVVTLGYRRQNGNLAQLELPLGAVMDAMKRRESLLGPPTLSIRTNEGMTGRVQDVRTFITPAPFQSAMRTLYQNVPSDAAFVQEVWHLVAQLNLTSPSLQGTPQYPLETILQGGGDCEDRAILFASLMRAAPTSWDVQIVYMDRDQPSNPQHADHMLVLVDTGFARYHVDATRSDVMTPYAHVRGWYFATN